ncbi:MAG: alpha/beta hydrolase [Aeromicrobium sp.]|uniref:alpha/beta hydrolase n=1 Tax=Aeromicrobium sp. TaxID=1871063 RepID=UPI0039E61C14
MIGEFVKRQTSVFDRASIPRDGALRLVRVGRGPVQVVDESVVVHQASSLRARVLQRGLRIVIKPTLTLLPFNDHTIKLLRRMDAISALGPRSRYVEPFEYRLGGVRVEQMAHRFGPDSDLTVLYFHGGGFFSCGIETHRRLCERLALITGGSVISVDYIQLPDGTVADSVQDAISAYVALLEQVPHPDKIIVAGDSAGGYLAMKVAEIAKRRGLQTPAAIIGFSPLLSLDPDRFDKGIEKVSRMNDAYLPVRKVRVVRRRWLSRDNAIEGCESPLDAAEYIDAPTFMTAVEDEMLRPEVEAMALQLAARGVEVETHLWRGQVHAFPVLADLLPESREAVRLAGRFARVAVGEPVKPEASEESGSVSVEPIVGELVPEEPVEQPVIDGYVVGEAPTAPGPQAQPAAPQPKRKQRWWSRWRRRTA